MLCGVALAATALLVGPAQARQRPAAAPGAIAIRVLDAHTGKPIAKEPLGVWLEKGIIARKSPTEAPTYITNSEGNAIVPLPPDAGVDDLSLWILRDIPCEPYNNVDYLLDYSIEKILTHGVVSDNVCGKAHHAAVPGVLIVFVKHHPWWQIGSAVPLSLQATPSAEARTGRKGASRSSI